jgi:hypothetical protein
MEDACEDYGQAAVYNGTCPGMPHTFALDDSHTFSNGQLQLVCGNTALMLGNTRLARYFNVIEGSSTRRHFGSFAGCAPSVPLASQSRKKTQPDSAVTTCDDTGGG